MFPLPSRLNIPCMTLLVVDGNGIHRWPYEDRGGFIVDGKDNDRFVRLQRCERATNVAGFSNQCCLLIVM